MSSIVILSIRQASNYGTPITLVIYFISTTILTQHGFDADIRKPSCTRIKRYLLCLAMFITLSYTAQAIQYLPHLSIAPDDGLIHSISQLLLWVSLSLILLETSWISPLAWGGTSAANFVFEALIVGLTSSQPGQPVTRMFTMPVLSSHILQLFALASFTILALLLVPRHTVTTSEEEACSLLRRQSANTTSLAGFCTRYSTIQTLEDDLSRNSDPGSEFGSDTDSDEEEMQQIQKERFRSTGGWIGYLKAFEIFMPFLFPRKSLKLQIYLVVLLINLLLQRALNILHPRQLGIVIDKLWQHGHIPWNDIILWNVFAIASSNSCGIGAINEMLENRLATWSRQELTYASLDHVMGLSMSFHDGKDSGEIIKAIEQAESLNELLRLFVVDLTPASLDVAISLWYVMYLLDIYASFIVVGMTIAFVYATFKISLHATVARRLSSRKERDESKLVYESVGNWFTISCFNHQRNTMDRLSRVLKERANATLWNDDLYTYIYFFQEGSEHIGQLAITILAAHRIIAGRSSVGDLVALESYWGTITWPLYVLGHDYRRMNSALVNAERLLQLFQVQPAVIDSPTAKIPSETAGGVTFNGVTFAYEAREPILRDFSLKALPGQTVALVGETGSGKSTLFKLMMRFYDVNSGSISIDGQDIRNVTLTSLRESFGFVPQDYVLFNMSVLENVRYGRLNATDREVFEACKAASIHDAILKLPRGYDTEVGERGVMLSGGERQRVAIARVFLKNPPIVLMDEATSAMDSETEGRIQTALKILTRGKTTFIIAHRLSTVVEADKILVLSEGRIVEEGGHKELLAKGGKYSDLWTRQATIVSL